jgi:hypothetical protein
MLDPKELSEHETERKTTKREWEGCNEDEEGRTWEETEELEKDGGRCSLGC